MTEKRTMKRQDSVLSSSSLRQTAPENRRTPAATVGCMSGIFKFVSKYQTRRRKFLIAVGRKKKEEDAPPPGSSPVEDKPGADTHQEEDAPPPASSPSVQSTPRDSPPESDRRTAKPAVVAQLMGLEEFPPPASSPPPPESVAEKRRRLLGTLERCDENLRALKKIIESLRTVAPQHGSEVKCNYIEDEKESKERSSVGMRGEGKDEVSGEKQSPVSVFDELTPSPPRSWAARQGTIGRATIRPQARRTREEKHITRLQGGGLGNKWRMWEGRAAAPASVQCCQWGRGAVEESVEEVWREMRWGEEREVGRAGLALHEGICRDLIEEFLKDMGSHRHLRLSSSLPLEACKRRLNF